MRKPGNKPAVIMLLPVPAMVMGTFLYLMGVPAKADKANISSKGNLVLEDGTEAAIYTEDIYYLQSEITELFNEIEY